MALALCRREVGPAGLKNVVIYMNLKASYAVENAKRNTTISVDQKR